MSIEVRIPKEITEYTEKIIFGLSIRQLLCFVVAISLGATTYLLTRIPLGTRTAGYLVMLIVLPIFAVGFLKKNGMAFEKYVAILLRHKLGTHKRTYQTNLLIDMLPKTTEKGVNNNVFKQRKKERECEVFESTEKSRKRKCKAARNKIKAAIKEYRQTKRAAEKAAKKAKKSDNSTANNKVSSHV